MSFTTNVVANSPLNMNRSRFKRTPEPQGASAQEQSSVYSGFYGEMPMPATAYVTNAAKLHAYEPPPSVRTVASNASVVQRNDRRDGIDYTGGRQSRQDELPQMRSEVRSSEWQPYLIGPIVNYILNDKWYIAYPAATISYGTMRNLAWSEKVPQLPTRTSGGPGPAAMMPAPRFRSVQSVPRYSTMPSTYNTQSQQL